MKCKNTKTVVVRALVADPSVRAVWGVGFDLLNAETVGSNPV
jgi:hypothetical protein